jgi:co-chaperonin GroES (HSP10)
MQIKLRGKRVAIEKMKRNAKKDNALFSMPETEEYCGVIRFLGPDVSEDLKVGQTVYFNTQIQEVRMAGIQLCVVDDSNVLAVADEEPKTES